MSSQEELMEQMQDMNMVMVELLQMQLMQTKVKFHLLKVQN